MEIEEGSDGSFGAGDGIRTRDINLGKVALYQLSYSREPSFIVARSAPVCQIQPDQPPTHITSGVTQYLYIRERDNTNI